MIVFAFPVENILAANPLQQLFPKVVERDRECLPYQGESRTGTQEILTKSINVVEAIAPIFISLFVELRGLMVHPLKVVLRLLNALCGSCASCLVGGPQF